jgi:rubrerythrin
VRETFGALQATYQAETAADPRVRRVMAQIAEDETRHAQLAWEIHAWLEPRLSDGQRAQVRAARVEALASLAADLDAGLSRDEYAALGDPTPEVSADLLRNMSRALYA